MNQVNATYVDVNRIFISSVLERLAIKQDLDAELMTQAMLQIMAGEWQGEQIAAFLMGLRAKGETVIELTSAAQVMRKLATPIHVSHPHLVDVCGTGGDSSQTFNISTAVGFVVAAAGGAVAKHGNRSVSSRSGAADVLEAADIFLDLTATQVATCIENFGFGFIFAPAHHNAMRRAMPARKSIGIRTMFNLLGPLTNPAQVQYQLLGVFGESWIEPLAEVLQALGVQRAIVVNGAEGLDEFSIAGVSNYAVLNAGKITRHTATPEDFGLTTASLAPLKVASPQESFAMIQRIFKKAPDQVVDPARDIVALNAGAALFVAGCVSSIEQGVELAQDMMANGLAAERLNLYKHATNIYRQENSANTNSL